MTTSTAKKAPAKRTTGPKQAAARTSGVSIRGEVLRLDPEDMTLGELEDFEEHAGRPFEEIMAGVPLKNDDGELVKDDKGKVKRVVKPSVKEILVMVWIAKRRTDPTFTLADARSVKIRELQLGSETDPQ